VNDCEKCEGNLYYLVPNYQHDIMERIECLDCMAEMQYQDDVKQRMAKLIVEISPQKLAQIVAELLVNSIVKDPNANLARCETVITTKNTREAAILSEMYAEAI
tara:strand:- start:233 stop:544 length:312 start_codon:yes stop_codon:yes gene_type:complete